MDYARSLGIEPHRDYFTVRPLFGDIDASKCPTEFVFGCKGKPRYVSGPYDTPARIRRILDTHHERVGKGNYDVYLMSGGFDLYGGFEEDDEFDDEDEEADDEPLDVIDVPSRRIE